MSLPIYKFGVFRGVRVLLSFDERVSCEFGAEEVLSKVDSLRLCNLYHKSLED